MKYTITVTAKVTRTYSAVVEVPDDADDGIEEASLEALTDAVYDWAPTHDYDEHEWVRDHDRDFAEEVVPAGPGAAADFTAFRVPYTSTGWRLEKVEKAT